MRVFVAGATGATGQVFLQHADGLDLVLHVRPKTAATHALGKDPRARVFDLTDAAALDAALRGCDAVLCLVGTMRKRFDTGDTYETSDVGPTRLLVEACRRVGVPRFVLMSSFGAGGMGAYMQAKGAQERIVRDSGLAFAIFRPSALASPGGAPAGHHGARDVPGFVLAAGAGLAKLPGVGPLVDDWRAMPLDVLARAFRHALAGELDGKILSGRDIWKYA
ncbi:MAG: NAD(P)H-binding protein [Myxococcota bacterium]